MRIALALIVGLVCLRIIVIGLSPTDLFFDEAQYWAWSQDLAFGYYSKPPLIGWVIRAFTELSGSIAPFWIRLPAPLFHGATALILAAWMRQIEPRAALPTAVIYLTLPILTIGSWLISTDTIMAPFFALALWAWWSYLEHRRLPLALLAGVAVGVAMMSKYAGIYFWLGVGVAALAHPSLRPKPGHVIAALGVCLLVLSPNLIWNVQNGLITFAHTAENVDWVQAESRLHFNVSGVVEFLVSQIMVIGPIFFVVWLVSLNTRADRDVTFLLAFSLPVLALVTLQALLSKAYGNWAAAAYFAAAPLVALWCARRRSWGVLWVGLGVNITLTLAVSVLILNPNIAPDLSKRYIGRTGIMMDLLHAANGYPVYTDARDVLADLTYAAARTNQRVFAPRPETFAGNYYEMHAPWDGTAPFVQITRQSILCPGSPLATVTAEYGAYTGQTFWLYLRETPCG